MQFSIYDVLGLLTGEKAVAIKVIQQKLGVEKSGQIERLQLALDALERLGLIEKSQGRYKRLEVEDLVAGKLRCTSKGYCFVIPEDPAQEELSVIDSGLRTAWNGDRVLVKALKKATRRRKPEAEVIVVTERANATLVGRLAATEGSLQVIPLDERLGGALELLTEEAAPLSGDDLIVQVAVERYPLGRRPAKSRLLRILGRANEPRIDIDLVCSRYQLVPNWPENIPASEPGLSVAPEKRQDLRKATIFTLPGRLAQCGVSVVSESKGGWQLGLHVSDLTALIAEEGAIDHEAQQRGSTTYLREQIASLWPEQILAQSALLPGEERPAWSLLAQVDAEGQVYAYRWTASTIRAKGVLETGHWPEAFQAVAQAIAGPLLSLLHSANDPQLFAELLEHLMGQHLAHLHVAAPFLVQAAPDGPNLIDWQRLARARGLVIPENENPEPPTKATFQEWLDAEATQHPILREMLLNTLPAPGYAVAPGEYFSRSGVGVGFAAPLESYADFLTQRILVQIVEEGKNRKAPRSKMTVDLQSSSTHGLIDWPVLPVKQQKAWEESLPMLLVRLQERQRQVKLAQEDLLGFDRIARLVGYTEPLQGLITGVQSYGFFVAIEDPFVEGLVHVSGLKDDWYSYQAREPALIGRRNRKRFAIGDTVRVKVKSIDYYRQQVDLMVLRSETETLEEPISVATPD